MQLFCMSFGQCSATGDYANRTGNNYSDDHGPGVQNHAIASGGDGTTRLVGGAIIGNNLDDQYGTKIKFILQRWYERQGKGDEENVKHRFSMLYSKEVLTSCSYGSHERC